MKHFLEYVLLLLVGQAIVWSIVYLASLLPSLYVVGLLGFAGFVLTSLMYILLRILLQVYEIARFK